MTSLTYVNECFHDFMVVNRTPPPPPPPPVNLVLQHCCMQSLAKSLLHYSSTIRTIRRLFADYSYYSSTIRGLFVLFADYSQTIRTIRRLFALFVDYSHYSHYSLHYSSFINCQIIFRGILISCRTKGFSMKMINSRHLGSYSVRSRCAGSSALS